MKIRILDEAEQDLVDGVLFYEAQDQGLGDYFLDSISADIDSLQLFGGIHPVRSGRHCLLATKFPYDCHVEPGWILIHTADDESLRLERTGTHSDLFR